MPTFNFKSPEGKSYVVNGPEGATQEQAFQILQRQLSEEKQQDALKDKSSFLGRLGTGMLDPAYGMAQLGAHMTDPGEEMGEAIGGMVPGAAHEKRAAAVDKVVREREQGIEAERGENAGSFDFARMLGNVFSPVNFIPVAGGVTRGSMLATGAVMGAFGGLASPVTSDNYWSKKAEQTVLGGLMGFGGSVVAKGVSTGVERAMEHIVRHIDPEAAETLVENKAIRTIAERMIRDQKGGGPKTKDVLALLAAAKKAGRAPLTLGDQPNLPAVMGLAGTLARRGAGSSMSFVRNFLSKRDEAAYERLSNYIAQHVHGGQTALEATKMLQDARSVAAAKSYSEMYNTLNFQGVWSKHLGELLQSGTIKRAIEHGWKMESDLAIAQRRPMSLNQLGVDATLDGMGNIIGVHIPDRPSMELLDIAKRGLDGLIYHERDKVTGKLSPEGYVYSELRKDFVSELDHLDPTGLYRKARSEYAGFSASLDAIRLGQTFLTRSPEENAVEMAALSVGDQEFARLGVANTLRERLAKGGFSSDESKLLIKNRWVREQLKPTFKSDAEFNEFADAVASETQAFEAMRRHVGGSQTAERVAEDQGREIEVIGRIAGIGADVMHGNILRTVGNSWRLMRALRIMRDPAMDEKVAQIIFNPNLSGRSTVGRKLMAATRGEDPALIHPSNMKLAARQAARAKAQREALLRTTGRAGAAALEAGTAESTQREGARY